MLHAESWGFNSGILGFLDMESWGKKLESWGFLRGSGESLLVHNDSGILGIFIKIFDTKFLYII
ncbi:TPA: hypothetical protein LAG04_001595 [Escherichia coli]|nr:hypothetical protein [Escherichia coli]